MSPEETKLFMDLSEKIGNIETKLDQAIIISNISPRTYVGIIGGLGIFFTISVKVTAGVF